MTKRKAMFYGGMILIHLGAYIIVWAFTTNPLIIFLIGSILGFIGNMLTGGYVYHGTKPYNDD